MIGNGSTYYHNYYMYHFMDEDLWQMFPWDLDKTMNSYGSYRQYFWWYENPFFEKSMLNKRIFSDIRYRIDELAATIFNSEHLDPIIDSLVTVLASSVEEDDGDLPKNLDDWLMEIECLKRLTYHIVNMKMAGLDVTKEVSMGKLVAGRLGHKVADGCLQMYGGLGYMAEMPISRAFRDSRLVSIGGGADEVMEEIIARMEGF